ncbi:hypothetical protein BDN72DRAFT_902369 [Pluteus cervinus]|uniref:Uncharacterized protein n=1 Tax=Pluteus cervinus TaxID=181527 RepID=A0ACD3ACV4_9AGAR|nr:hypothetical protein BDN72DRAFT_902369 [Pluteus cervinus]
MSASDHVHQPRLPPELEQDIFLLAIEQTNKNLSDTLNFILVAKRVHDWLIPKIFNIVIFNDNEASPTPFQLSTFQRYAKHVQHLFLEPHTLVQHLSLFVNVTNLVLWREFDASQLEVLLTFNHLTRLSIAISNNITPSPIYFTLFSKLTHLDLISSCKSWSPAIISPLINFPLLTHLCILTGSNIEVIKLFLDQNWCSNLRVVVLWGSAEMVPVVPPPPWMGRDGFPVEDERFFYVLCRETIRDWESGAKGGDDMWKVADRYLASCKGSI